MRGEIAACFRLSIRGPPKSCNKNLEAVIILWDELEFLVDRGSYLHDHQKMTNRDCLT